MALYKITVFQRFATQQVINRWYYQTNSTPAVVSGSFALAGAFGVVTGVSPAVDTVFADWRNNISDQVTFDEVLVENLYDPIDFYAQPFVAGTTGNATGASEPPFVALGFRTSRTRTDIRRGTKRFVGALDGQTDNQGVILPAALANLQVLANRMSESITYDDEGNVLSFVPAILKFQSYTTPAGNTAYQKYPTLAEQEQNMSIGFQWAPYETLRSQTSRQYGRGQ